LQETRAQEYQLPLDAHYLGTYSTAYADATVRKGYSGVAIFTRRAPDALHRGFGPPGFDDEGRYVQADFGSLSIGSLYVPSGSAGPHRRAWKWEFLDELEAWMQRAARSGRSYILCGDFNLAHEEIDVYDPARASRQPGFLPKDRAWLSRVLGGGWTDAVRAAHPNERGIYTWWSHAPHAFAENKGWRIDFQLVTTDIAASVRSAYVYTGRRFSDHGPVIVEYDLDP
jgi:exodeoxyribonuclease-3